MKLFHQYMAIFFTFSPASNHLHPLQVENCDSNSRLVVDEDDNGKFRFERVKCTVGYYHISGIILHWFLCFPTPHVITVCKPLPPRSLRCVFHIEH